MRNKLLIVGITCVICLVAGWGCSKKSDQKTGGTKEETKPQSNQATPEAEIKPPPGVDVFSSYDDHNKYNKRTAWGIMNDAKYGYRGQAEWFAPTKAGPLNFVDIAVGGKGEVNVTVAADNNGKPGPVLETFSGVSSSRYGHKGHLILVSAQHPALNEGAKYWVCVEPAGADAGCSWYYNAINLAQGSAFERGQGSWSSMPGSMPCGAFRVNVLP